MALGRPRHGARTRLHEAAAGGALGGGKSRNGMTWNRENRMRRRTCIAISLALASGILNCPSAVDAASDVGVTAAARVTVTDDFGHEVTVNRPPLRIVSLAP